MDRTWDAARARFIFDGKGLYHAAIVSRRSWRCWAMPEVLELTKERLGIGLRVSCRPFSLYKGGGSSFIPTREESRFTFTRARPSASSG